MEKTNIEKNKKTLKCFRELIDNFNNDLENMERESGFYVNFDVEVLHKVGSLYKKHILIPREVCIF